jgi:hypothetical protein
VLAEIEEPPSAVAPIAGFIVRYLVLPAGHSSALCRF